MRRSLQLVLALFILVCVAAPTVAQGLLPKGKAKIELRWVESKPIEGLTETEGFQTSCDPDSIMYPHKKPALIITAAEVTEVKLKNNDFSKSGLSKSNYMVAFHLTKEAREKLAATTEGNEMKFLTVMVDDKPWGLHRYEKDKDKPFVPTQCRAETFLPEVGFFSSRYEAQRVVDAVK
jgi:hypothetical protein